MKRAEVVETWEKLLEAYQNAIEEEEKKLESLRREERHIKQEIEKLK